MTARIERSACGSTAGRRFVPSALEHQSQRQEHRMASRDNADDHRRGRRSRRSLAHGIDTVYALPGVHNDHLFDALFKARRPHPHGPHPPRAGRRPTWRSAPRSRPASRRPIAVVPGPGLLNCVAPRCSPPTAMNAPVLALVGADSRRATSAASLGHLHEMRDQAGIIARLVDHSAAHRRARRCAAPGRARRCAPWRAAGRGPAALECADRRVGQALARRTADRAAAAARARDRRRRASSPPQSGSARPSNPMIVCGGGAQDAAPEVTAALRHAAGAGAAAIRRGRGVLDSRDPLSVTLPLGHELWARGRRGAGGRHAAVHHRTRHAGASTTISRSSASTPIRRSPAACASRPSR